MGVCIAIRLALLYYVLRPTSWIDPSFYDIVMQTYTWYIISYLPANSRSARVGGLLYCGVSR